VAESRASQPTAPSASSASTRTSDLREAKPLPPRTSRPSTRQAPCPTDSRLPPAARHPDLKFRHRCPGGDDAQRRNPHAIRPHRRTADRQGQPTCAIPATASGQSKDARLQCLKLAKCPGYFAFIAPHQKSSDCENSTPL